MTQILTGVTLHIARYAHKVLISDDAKQRMQAIRVAVEFYTNENKPAFSVTTGLGYRVTYRLSAEELAGFSLVSR